MQGERRSDVGSIHAWARSGGGTLRLRCEVRPGGTATATASAIGDEVELDFDSNPGDVAEGDSLLVGQRGAEERSST